MNKEVIRKRELGVCRRLCNDLSNAGGSYSRLLAVNIPYTHTHTHTHTHTEKNADSLLMKSPCMGRKLLTRIEYCRRTGSL
jgi:hypothetical protein